MKLFLFITALFFLPGPARGFHADFNRPGDNDYDGLVEAEEVSYHTDPANPDSDADGYKDGDEVSHGYDPLTPGAARLTKRIDVDLSEQRLRYFHGEFHEAGSFLISSGVRRMPTPLGSFQVEKKLPVVRYKGTGYDYPNAKWNLRFKPKYYIHGAYWHHNFGRPMSHGCVNVSYADMEKLYNFADEGTPIIIHK
jgi:lipoprotein-anchoring transpeptidase ErfK/SrfK